MDTLYKAMERLENDYKFTCEAGTLANCQDWLKLKGAVMALKIAYTETYTDLTRPTPQPSSEYVKAEKILESVDTGDGRMSNLNISAANAMVDYLRNVIDEALAALKSHPTPAKEKP